MDDVPSSIAPSRARPSRRSRAAKAHPRRLKPANVFAGRLTRKVVETIREQLENGAPIKGAAAYAGVPTRTLYDWLARGRNGAGTPLERELASTIEAAVERAKADGATRLWNEDDWRAVAWVMERRFPSEFGPPERRHLHGGAVGLYAAITPERLRSALEADEISIEDAHCFARVWRVLMGGDLAGEVVEGEARELESGEAA